MPKKRKIPQRTCIVCRSQQEKRALLRVVRTPTGEIQYDPTGKMAGRGAYLCHHPDCIQKAFRGDLLANALKTTLDEFQKEQLRSQLEDLIRDEGSV